MKQDAGPPRASRPRCRTPARLLRVSRARRPVPASAFPLRALVPGPRKLPLQVHFAGPSPSSRAKQCPCLPRRRAGAALRPRPPSGLCIASCVTVRNDLTGLSSAPPPSAARHRPVCPAHRSLRDTPDTVHKRSLTSPGAQVFHCDPFGVLEKKAAWPGKIQTLLDPRPQETLKSSPSVSSKNNPTGMWKAS